MSSDVWARYNCIDSAVDFKIWNVIEPDLKTQGYETLYRDTMALYDPIIFMQTIGMLIDQENLALERDNVNKLITENEKKLYEECGFELNPNSPKQCQQYFYGILGHQVYLGPRGNITTDDKAMARLVRKGVKEAKYVQNIRGLRKLLGTYLEVSTDFDGRIRSSFNPRGTTTGRLSSSQTIFGTGLNFQNLHPQFKSFIVADPGRIFISMDKAKAEWVITAYVCNDAKMIGAIEAGEDVHAKTISEMTGVPMDLIKKEQKIIGHLTDAIEIEKLRLQHIPELLDIEASFLPRTMSLRQCGKKTNHGCNYREGYRMFALTNEIREKEAKLYVDAYRSTYINLPLWWEAIERQLAKNRTILNCFGHPRRFLGEWGNDLFKQAIAYLPQSTSVWVLNHAMCSIYNDKAPWMEDLWLHAQVHDELLFSYPIDRWENMARAIIDCETYMTPKLSHCGRSFTIGTDLSIGLNWGEAGTTNPKGMTSISLSDNPNYLAYYMQAHYGSIVN